MKPAPFGYERPRDLPAALAAGGRDRPQDHRRWAVARAHAKSQAGRARPHRRYHRDRRTQAGRGKRRRTRPWRLCHPCRHRGWPRSRCHARCDEGVAANIAYRAVRNRGTIGGSISHADPSADWVSALSALGATLTLRGPAGLRKVAMKDFVTGALKAVSSRARSSSRSMCRSVRLRPIGAMSRVAEDGRVRACALRRHDRSGCRLRTHRHRRG